MIDKGVPDLCIEGKREGLSGARVMNCERDPGSFFCFYPAGAAAGSCFLLVKLGGLRLTYFFLAISYTVAVCDCVFLLYDFFLLLLLLYTVAVCDCVFLLYDFFLLLLSTLQSLISPTWLDRFWPDLVTSTGWPSHLCHMTRLGSKVT